MSCIDSLTLISWRRRFSAPPSRYIFNHCWVLFIETQEHIIVMTLLNVFKGTTTRSAMYVQTTVTNLCRRQITTVNNNSDSLCVLDLLLVSSSSAFAHVRRKPRACTRACRSPWIVCRASWVLDARTRTQHAHSPTGTVCNAWAFKVLAYAETLSGGVATYECILYEYTDYGIHNGVDASEICPGCAAGVEHITYPDNQEAVTAFYLSLVRMHVDVSSGKCISHRS